MQRAACSTHLNAFALKFCVTVFVTTERRCVERNNNRNNCFVFQSENLRAIIRPVSKFEFNFTPILYQVMFPLNAIFFFVFLSHAFRPIPLLFMIYWHVPNGSCRQKLKLNQSKTEKVKFPREFIPCVNWKRAKRKFMWELVESMNSTGWTTLRCIKYKRKHTISGVCVCWRAPSRRARASTTL